MLDANSSMTATSVTMDLGIVCIPASLLWLVTMNRHVERDGGDDIQTRRPAR